MVPQSRFLVNTTRKDSEYQRFLNQLPLSILMFGASTALFVDMIVADRFASFLGCLLALLGTVCVSYQQGSNRIFSSVQRWGRQYKLNIALLVFSLIGDEDWQTLARTPLIILITVTLGDILAGLITGGGAGGAA